MTTKTITKIEWDMCEEGLWTACIGSEHLDYEIKLDPVYGYYALYMDGNYETEYSRLWLAQDHCQSLHNQRQ